MTTPTPTPEQRFAEFETLVRSHEVDLPVLKTGIETVSTTLSGVTAAAETKFQEFTDFKGKAESMLQGLNQRADATPDRTTRIG